MLGGEVVIPCPQCRAALRSRTDADGHPMLRHCLICGALFPPELLQALRAFLIECFGGVTVPTPAEAETEPQPV